MESFTQRLRLRADCPASGNVGPQEHRSLTQRPGWLAVLLWVERSRQRRALAELATFNDHMLKDIGLSQEQARREAAKPFWWP